MSVGRKGAVARGSSPDRPVPVLTGTSLTRLARRHPDLARALEELAANGTLAGSRSGRVSARVDPGVLAAAARRFDIPTGQVSEVINASLALAAAPDRFKQWLRDDHDTIPNDFELAI